ncbi:metal-dependent transcriptional regulator [Prolixibacter denitrificans]|uniref:Transcriptional regulator MntR n=1 Tax=Prolixibacter denitrificans TaxID=1541063 RepID=A0A2P8CAN3_9BACT|nr:metal-dependent transcriptional regulator [Prolixibacter denitrificans]PSK82018.1 DtxR family Mn-dependent transcriptional regulator [Prolixibacter denitrificans]GET22611.1 iron-dependent repressor [Prolixibacter denitrificans]
MASVTEENYLKALFILVTERGMATISDLSKLLKVSLPTANSMIKNLKKQELVNYEKYKPLSLTEKGRREAALVLRKHRLTEMFLVNEMGFGWEEVHEIAEQIEHINSPIFFDRMDKLMGHPTIDPHGSPIPDKDGHIAEEVYEQLSNCRTGEKVRLIALAHSASDFLRYLNNRDLSLGVEMRIVSIEAYDGSMVVSYDNHPAETLTHPVCEKLRVEKVD